MKTIAVFNNKGGVGKTTLVYHLTWMLSNLGLKVLAVDLDPQANLTSMFLTEDRLEELWPDGEHEKSLLGTIKPIQTGLGDVKRPHIEDVSENIGILVGDLGLSTFEDRLSTDWPKCHDGDVSAFRVTSAFYRLIEMSVEEFSAQVVLVDVGPNLGAINRSALIASEYVFVPLAPDLFSIQGLKNLGPSLRRWNKDWKDRLPKNPDHSLVLPNGNMEPAGYVILQHAVRADRPVKAYQRWMDKIPGTYRKFVLGEKEDRSPTWDKDPYCLSLLKNYRSLMPLAMEARKPMFALKPADGAIGAHIEAVSGCYSDFELLAKRIAHKCGIAL